MSLLVGEQFSRLLRTFEHTAFRLEVRDRYNVASERERVREFLAGKPDASNRPRAWLEMVRAAAAEGRRFMRVRVVSVPLTDYSRYGLWSAQFTNAAGEDIRYLPRDQAQSEGLPNYDWWLFDSRKLALMTFDDDDRFLGAEIVEDPAAVVQHCYWRDVAWHWAIPRDEFATRLE